MLLRMENTNAAQEQPAHVEQQERIVPAPIGATAEALAARISEELKRLAVQEAIERDLTAERKRLLVEGTEAEVDACEMSIDASRSAQVRILERVDLLKVQLAEAYAAENQKRLDAIEDDNRSYRAKGEQLHSAYADHAAALAQIFATLQAIDVLIAANDYALVDANREPIGSPNTLRFRSVEGWVASAPPVYEVTTLPHGIEGDQPFWDASMQTVQRFAIPGYVPNERDEQQAAALREAMANVQAECAQATSNARRKRDKVS